MTLNSLLKQLSAESLINPAAIPDMLKTAQERTVDERPWYLQLLIAVTALIAVNFISSSVGAFISLILYGFDIPREIIGIIAAVFGVILCAIAIFSQRKIPPNNIFVKTIMLAMMVIGAGLIVFGIASATYPLWDALWPSELYFDRNDSIPCMIALTIAAVTFFLYNSRVYRVLAFATAFIALCIIIVLWEFEDGIHILITLCAAVSVYLWQKRPEWQASPRADMLDPLSYAIPVALCTLTTFAVMDTANSNIDYWWLSTLILGCVLTFFTLNLLRDYGVSLTSPAALIALIGCVILSVPALIMPGITAGFLIILLAFWRNNRILMGVATLYFLFGIGYYYYNLGFTLLTKSIVLMVTGGVLLAGSALARRLTA